MIEQLRKKSPRAPSLSLDQAIEIAIKIYDRERTHEVPIDVAAQTLGYKSANNGSVLSLLAALRYFGLLDRPKEGFVSVPKKVEAYKFAPDENLKKSLLRDFLLAPALYKELLDKYASGLPSEANLKHELIQKGFLPQSVDGVLSSFIKSVEFANYYLLDNNRHDDHEHGQRNIKSKLQVPVSEGEAKNIPPAQLNPFSAQQSLESDSANHDQIPIRLSSGRKAWLVIPSPFYEADKARIKAQVDILLSDDDDL